MGLHDVHRRPARRGARSRPRRARGDRSQHDRGRRRGARARRSSAGCRCTSIVGSEIKTASDGEIIGLFLHDEIPRGLTFAETIERIHAQGGVVYVPHPFDRFHSTPEEAVLREHVGSIDVLETANARLWLERDNRRAERFAREHGLRRGAGSDAHVPGGIGTAALRLAAFDDPVSFLAAVDGAEIVRKPRSMLRLQIAKRRRSAPGRVATVHQVMPARRGTAGIGRARSNSDRGACGRALRALPGACDQRGERTWR